MSRTPKVLHLRASNFFGGPERQILRYTKLGDVVSDIASYTGDGCGTEFLAQAAKQGLTTWELPAGKKSVHRAIAELRKILVEQRISLLCTHDYRSDIVGLFASRKAGIPWVPFLRGWTGENQIIRLFEAFDRRVLRFASRVVCLSQTHASEMRQQPGLSKKVRVVVNAIAVSQVSTEARQSARRLLRSRYGLPETASVVVSAGRLSPEKGVAVLLDSIPSILRDAPETQFVIFGDGSERTSLERQASKLGLDSNVKFAGHTPDFNALLSGADILINASYSEQMPNVVLEAMAAGVAVVATTAGAVAEIAGDPPAVSLVNRGDSLALAKAAARLLADSARREGQAATALARLQTAFSPGLQQSQLRSLYRELVPLAAQQHDEQRPLVSVVIPVRNEARHLGSVLDSLLQQDYPSDKVEILVADGNSTDDTAKVIQSYSGRGVRYVPNPAQLSSAGRNAGVRNSRGDVVVFVDGHCEIAARSMISDAVALLHRTGVDCLARPQPLTVQDASPLQALIAAVRANPLGHGLDSTIFNTSFEGEVDPTSSGAIYRREVFDRIGMYDEAFDACEDVEFNHRVKQAGLRCWISPDLTVFYHPRATLNGLFKQMVRYGRGRCRLARKHPDAASFAQLIPALFILALLVGGVASIFLPAIRYAYLAIIAVYLIAVAIASLTLWRKVGAWLCVAPAAFFTIHSGLGVGFLAELASGTPKPATASDASSLPARGINGGRT